MTTQQESDWHVCEVRDGVMTIDGVTVPGSEPVLILWNIAPATWPGETVPVETFVYKEKTS